MSKRKPIDLDQLSDFEIKKSFYLSQAFLFMIACIGFFVFYESMPPLSKWMTFHPFSVILIGCGSGIILAGFELIIDKLVPKTWFDDGGINRRVFQALSHLHIFFAILVVAVVEEFLFRGVLQAEFGFVFASLLFGFIHIRYLKKPLMLFVALGMGFYLGYLYIVTESLIVPIAAHYTIDVILGFVLKDSFLKDRC